LPAVARLAFGSGVILFEDVTQWVDALRAAITAGSEGGIAAAHAVPIRHSVPDVSELLAAAGVCPSVASAVSLCEVPLACRRHRAVLRGK
jgi:hypothetical protein